MSRASKIRRKYRKAVTRTLTVLRGNFIRVSAAYAKDKVWNTTPDEVATSVEAMLFTVWQEFAEWPDGWTHKHVFWDDPARFSPADGACSCGARQSVDFDGVHPVFGVAPVDGAYDLRCTIKVQDITVRRGVMVYLGSFWIGIRGEVHRERGGTLMTQRPSTIRTPDGRVFSIGDTVHQPLYDTLIRTVNVANEPATDPLSLLEMGPPQG